MTVVFTAARLVVSRSQSPLSAFLLEGAGYGVGSEDGYLDRRSALPQGEIQVDASGKETDRVRRSEVPAVVPN